MAELSLAELVMMIDSPNRERCQKLLSDNAERFYDAWGSSHNHQAWTGGYLDHIADVMNLARKLYVPMTAIRELPFTIPDALLVLFLHDIEKPWKSDYGIMMLQRHGLAGLEWNKLTRSWVRNIIIEDAGITLTDAQLNAMKYVEGEGGDYSSQRRVMNELAAFCHMCDVASARIWHSK